MHSGQIIYRRLTMLVPVAYGPNLLATEVRFLAYFWCKIHGNQSFLRFFFFLYMMGKNSGSLL